VKTVADPAIARALIERLEAVQPDAPRRWGTLTAHEMLCHLGDATDMVLGVRPRKQRIPARRRPLIKYLGLWCPVPWPRGMRTNPMHDPRAEGTRPTEFTKDLARAIAGIQGIAAAVPGRIEPVHGLFGTMSLRDWQRWAYRHTDYHLRQFGC
jgi:hypothetical protein